jgi:5-(aminomethyl)-3-furanmethanol phosphate kinase
MLDRWVIKLGGSLFASPQLKDWLSAISEHGKGRVVVVSGGGSFADAVRDAQRKIGFDDVAAHRMAMLAMEQSAVMLADLQADFVTAKNKNEIEAAQKNRKIPIWMPTEMALAATDIPANWDMTSDSLAAWLAAELPANGLLIVKSCDISNSRDISTLAKNAIVDRLLPHFAIKKKFVTHVLSQHGLLVAIDLLTTKHLLQ